ncbi:hypothetical protein SBRCBS47491_009931 [Sporothrix bragantina]|uniref:Zn(2)-C6 fungal-type domain-containing protein n=1 Tax=Sporothrix bragantina TaxID=671064 RepID=A0ABP0CYT6_9PEZI
MEKRGPTAGSGTYGLACVQCSKAKCRCIARPDGGACERCFRLKKPCQPSNSVRRRTAQTQNGQAGEIAKLEGRINTLTTLLQSVMEKTGLAATEMPSVEGQAEASQAPSEQTAGATDTIGTATSGSSDTASMTLSDDEPGPCPFPTPFHTPLATRPHASHALSRPPPPSSSNETSVPHSSHAPPSPPSEPPLYELSLDEASWYLDRFCTCMLPHFPFISLTSGATAAQKLCQDRPLLMQAIIAVATPSNKQKAVRADRLKQILTRCAVLENQSNIDVLLSMLVYITWSTDPFQQPANNLSRMTMLSVSVVNELQLATRAPPAPDAQYIAIMTPGFERPSGTGTFDGSGGGSGGRSLLMSSVLERQRAYLACFVLSSIVSASFGRMVAMRWTTQMEEGLQLIENSQQSPSDADLAVQVRLQIFVQRAALVREQQEADRALSSSFAAVSTATAPVSTNMYMKLLQDQLKELRDSFSPRLQRRDMLLIYSHYAELCLNEVTRLASSEAPLVPSTTGPSSTAASVADASGGNIGGRLPVLEHIACLWRSVYAIKAWLDAYHAILPSTYVGVPFFFWFQLVRCVVLLKHLSTFKDPAWDCQAVRNAVDMGSMLSWMAAKADEASKEAGEQSDDDLFRRVSSIMRMSQAWMAAKQRAASVAAKETHTHLPHEAAAHSVPTNQYGNTSGGYDGSMSATTSDMANENLVIPVDPSWTNAFDMSEEMWLEDMIGWPMATI